MEQILERRIILEQVKNPSVEYFGDVYVIKHNNRIVASTYAYKLDNHILLVMRADNASLIQLPFGVVDINEESVALTDKRLYLKAKEIAEDKLIIYSSRDGINLTLVDKTRYA